MLSGKLCVPLSACASPQDLIELWDLLAGLRLCTVSHPSCRSVAALAVNSAALVAADDTSDMFMWTREEEEEGVRMRRTLTGEEEDEGEGSLPPLQPRMRMRRMLTGGEEEEDSCGGLSPPPALPPRMRMRRTLTGQDRGVLALALTPTCLVSCDSSGVLTSRNASTCYRDTRERR